jgi:NAD(P)-dependent dehydrogenase (short-subunit alcohol dehydrogenase family)
MDSFAGKLAVVTGGGSGMGRELVIKLAAQGCAVAACDVRQAAAEETAALARAVAPDGTTVTAHACDVADAAQVARFRDEALAAHGAANHVDLVFSNAGTGGAGSFVNDPPEMWERVFAVDFWGVYHCARVFLPLLMKSSEGVLVNTSSVNGFWASAGPYVPHTAYSAAKFAVKGFTEGLIADLRVNAPHIKCSVVMPGHIGTSILANTRKIHAGTDAESPSATDIAQMRRRLATIGRDVSSMSDEEIEKLALERARRFLEEAPTTAEQAATIILDGVKADRWRILVGEDAKRLDERVRAEPQHAYEVDFYENFATEINWFIGR